MLESSLGGNGDISSTEPIEGWMYKSWGGQAGGLKNGLASHG